MAYKVQLSPHAAKQYHKLHSSIQSSVRVAIDTLQHAPLAGPKIKRLKGRLHAYYRYRIGDYRIVYAVDQPAHAVYIDYVQHRKDVYRGNK